MPDISMCQGGQCQDRQQCYRFMAKPNEYRQAYANFPATIATGAKRCDDFVPVYPELERSRAHHGVSRT